MSRILIVITSHDRLGETGQKTGFWLEELASPYYVFVDAGAEVTLASIKGGEPPLDPKSHLPESQTESTQRFMADEEAKTRLQNTVAIADINAEDYDAIFLSGGHGTMWDFPNSVELTQTLEAFDRDGKVIAAVCHAPAALVAVKSASGEPLVKGRTITAFTDSEERAVQLESVVPFLLETRLRDLGSNFKAEADFAPHVEEDGLLISGQNPASSELAAERVLQRCRDRN
ncbi:MAG TPA: type 1 glutamine amidotransferase domain-containing protein [Oscillatoriales cyanobacterium M59_W2019_021]|nr:type 1 glutamine amidotransferase domain-containing protein [Oscillatoriales cyanobacterium M4454_W2019_049]HIK51755.1 type 1 glutamine amidotransferase domain-containing protein [Oscillatoriales cyanobacterium M59_W2019_021]